MLTRYISDCFFLGRHIRNPLLLPARILLHFTRLQSTLLVVIGQDKDNMKTFRPCTVRHDARHGTSQAGELMHCHWKSSVRPAFAPRKINIRTRVGAIALLSRPQTCGTRKYGFGRGRERSNDGRVQTAMQLILGFHADCA